MSLLDPPILFSLELHLSADGHVRTWTTPRDLAAFTPADRILIARACATALDQLYADLGVRQRIEVGPTLTPDSARQILDAPPVTPRDYCI